MRRRKHFRKKKYPKEELQGLQVKVYNNNIEGALKKFKKKVKESGIMLELRKKTYYKKPSEIKREKKNLAKLRYFHKNNKNNKKPQKNYK